MISMSSRSAIKLLNCKALLCLPHRRILADTTHRIAGSGSPMFLEHLKASRGLNHGRTSRGAYERASVQDEPLCVNDIKAARYVLLAPHRAPLKEFTSLRKKPEDRGGLFPVWGYPWVQPENTTTQTQAEDLFWRWVSLKNFTVQKLKELREDRLLSYVLDQRDLRIEFAHLVAKRQLHSVMEGLRQQSKSSAQDERGYGSVNPGTVHRKAAKKPRTTYAPAVDPKSQLPSGSQPGAGLPAPTSSVTRDNLATSKAAGAFTERRRFRTTRSTCEARRSDQGGQEELSHAFDYAAPSQPYPSEPSTSGRDPVGSLLSDEVRQLRGVLTLVFLRPRRKSQRIVIPLKTPHVERRVRRREVNGIRRAMSGQDRKGSNEAVLQLVAPYGANQVYR
ncbi:LOW QUALITY PROTEIN: hypothetical protein PHPALM_28038 [Phytophthora palmivora]|uniref:ATP-binding cassette (ABC) Superfamily n=1 Tax=Phytophthora palmivora TaxID=4796 RepID=A0A2P4XB38_9STRA|nr:LOW QUALITY PROTEIN: hypothetical protein PHPALM_28038 [Phytophthora palmivora]